MKDEDRQFLGKALLAIGGGIVVGAIIDSWFEEEESSRETLQDPEKPKTTRKKTSRSRPSYDNFERRSEKIPNQISKPSQPTRFLIEVPREDSFKRKIPESILQLPTQEDRKYPENYYTLSKAQQYKYRKKMSNQLFQISQERK